MVAMVPERMIGVTLCDSCKIINKFVHNTTSPSQATDTKFEYDLN